MSLNEALHEQIAVQGSVIDALREAIVRQIADARVPVATSEEHNDE